MKHSSKAWLFLICLLSYVSMGQAGCQTMMSQQDDIPYIRSDIAHMKRDIEEIKQKLGSPASSAQEREALVELQEGQQRIESKSDETTHQVLTLKQEIANLKVNLISQMEALRVQMEAMKAAGKGSGPQQPPQLGSPLVPSAPPSAPLMPSLTPAMPAAPAPKAPAPAPTAPLAPVTPSIAPVMPPAMSAPPAVAAPTVPEQPAPAVMPSKHPEAIDYTRLYDTAYEDYVRQNYALARSEFEEYLSRFPDTDLADNAQYWIGECFYAEGKYEEAADAFKKVITKYPTGNKVPRAMLKAGYAYLQLGKEEQAKAMFQQVVDAYPLSSEADQAKSKLKTMR